MVQMCQQWNKSIKILGALAELKNDLEVEFKKKIILGQSVTERKQMMSSDMHKKVKFNLKKKCFR